MRALALVGLFGCALVLRLSITSGGVEELLLRVTSDDAYYYFQIARQLAEGNGASFDGRTPTNGFHPLWLLICTAIHALGAPGLAAVKAALALGAVLGAATSLLTWAVVRRLGGRHGPALLAGAFTALHPTVALESVNGLETGLTLFLLALVVWLALCASAARPRAGSLVGLGAAGGLMLLARTDTAVVWAALLLQLAASSVRRDGPRGLAAPLLAGAISAAVVAPWLVWSLVRFGTIVQVSAVALPDPLRADFLARHGDSWAVILDRSGWLVRQALGQTLVHLYLVPRSLPAWPGWLLVGAALAAMLATPREPARRRARRALRQLAPLAGGVLLTLLIHAGVRWWLREWYFAPAGWVAAVFLGLALSHATDLLDSVPRPWGAPARAGLGACVVGGLVLLATPAAQDIWAHASPHRLQQLEAARWLEAHTDPAARVGSFNAGILGYFSGRTVVNLDGAVNADAYRAGRRDQLMDYVLAQEIDYLVDWRGTLPVAGCQRSRVARCPRVAVVGEPLPRFAGSPIWVLRVELPARTEFGPP